MKNIKLPLYFSIVLICFCGKIACKGQNIKDDRNPFHLTITQTSEAYRRQVAQNPGMLIVDLAKRINGVVLDIRYATANNFTGEVIYVAPRAFARKPVADALQKVQDSLLYYRLGLKIYDTYRPYAATLRFYKVYPDSNFVANPRYGSRHNRGCALDIGRKKHRKRDPNAFSI
jgi:D-alanyl-D-alanine dipeptidase